MLWDTGGGGWGAGYGGQESNAESAIEALASYNPDQAKVRYLRVGI